MDKKNFLGSRNLFIIFSIFLLSFNFISARNFETVGVNVNNNITVNGTHNSLVGLQGGSVGEFYHLNQTVFNAVLANYSLWITSAGADTFIANFTNFTRIYSNVTLYNTSWSNTTNLTYFIGYNYAVNSTGGGVTWADVINGTMLSYAQALNGTLWLANNNSYAYSLNNSLWTLNYSNFSIGWLYATNSTGGSDSFIANFTNFTRIYANVTDYNTSWSSITNTSYLLTSNVTYAYSLNNSLWTLNYSNFSIGWLYATNSTGADSFIANYSDYLTTKNHALNWTNNWSNFTRIYANVTDYNTSWTSITNTSYLLTSNVTYAYSLNNSLWTLNYSTYLLKPTWAQVTNTTLVALNGSINTWNANQSYVNNYLTNGTGGAFIYHNGTGWIISG